MTIGFLGLDKGSFRLTDVRHSEEVTEAQPFFELTDGELTFRAEQISGRAKKKPLRRFLRSMMHFTRVIWDGFFGHPAVFADCGPIMLEAEIEVKNTRFLEQTLVFTPSNYAPDIHDYTTPKLEGGRDFRITPISYRVDEGELDRRKKETLIEKLGASAVLFLIPTLLLIAAGVILSKMLVAIALFAAVILLPLIPVMLIRWRGQCKQFAEKAEQKAIALNDALGQTDY